VGDEDGADRRVFGCEQRGAELVGKTGDEDGADEVKLEFIWLDGKDCEVNTSTDNARWRRVW
jgi:hypothetical protein